MADTIIERFHDAFANPHQAAHEWKSHTGGKVVGCIGADVPFEMIAAAGMLPVRIIGRPQDPTDRIAPYVGEGVDPGARSIAERLIDGTYDYVDHVVICSKPELYGSLYEFMLESRRVHGDVGLPIPTLFDFFRSTKLTASLFDRETLRRFRRQLADWSGNEVGDAALEEAIAGYNEARALLAKVNALRCGDTPRLSGTDGLAVNASHCLIPREDHVAMMRELLQSAESLPVRRGIPVIYSGTATERTEIYAAIEAGGAQIVADDQEFGSSAVETMADPDAPSPIDALCDRIQLGAPRALGSLVHHRADYVAGLAGRTGASAVLFHILAIDHPSALDYPRLRDRLAAAGIPSTEYGPRLYNDADFAPLTEQTQEFLATLGEHAPA